MNSIARGVLVKTRMFYLFPVLDETADGEILALHSFPWEILNENYADLDELLIDGPVDGAFHVDMADDAGFRITAPISILPVDEDVAHHATELAEEYDKMMTVH